jgi:hypothetical protein
MHVPVLAIVTVVMAVTDANMLCQIRITIDDLTRFMVGMQDRSRAAPQAEAQHHPDQCPEKPGKLSDSVTGVEFACGHTSSVS